MLVSTWKSSVSEKKSVYPVGATTYSCHFCETLFLNQPVFEYGTICALYPSLCAKFEDNPIMHL